MRDYSKVSPRYWIGSTGKKLRKSPHGLIVSMYLMTCSHANMLGLYYLPLVYLAHETGLPTAAALQGLESAIDAGFCGYDHESECVWVYEMARFQVGEQLKPADNQVKGVQRDYDNLPDNPFLSEFYDKYQAVFHMSNRRGQPKPVAGILAASHLSGSTIQAPGQAHHAIASPPDKPLNKPLASQEQEQAQEQEQQQDHAQDLKKINTAAPVLKDSTAEGQDSGWRPTLTVLNNKLNMAGTAAISEEQLGQYLVAFNLHYDDGPVLTHNKRLGKLVSWIQDKQQRAAQAALKSDAKSAMQAATGRATSKYPADKPIQQQTTEPGDHEIFSGVFSYGFLRAVGLPEESSMQTMQRIMLAKLRFKSSDIEHFLRRKREQPTLALEQVLAYAQTHNTSFATACDALAGVRQAGPENA